MQVNNAPISTPIVFLVDDDADVLNSMVVLMEVQSIPCRSYQSAVQFLKDYDPRQPGCVVVDMRMPLMSGIQMLERMRASGIEIPVIVITGHGDILTAVKSMQLGAIEFLQKPVDPRLLVAKLRDAIAKDAARRAQHAEIDSIRARLGTLTNREHELLSFLVTGMSNKQIATEMGIAEKTVEHHRAHVMTKTGAVNVADLVRMKMLADD